MGSLDPAWGYPRPRRANRLDYLDGPAILDRIDQASQAGDGLADISRKLGVVYLQGVGQEQALEELHLFNAAVEEVH